MATAARAQPQNDALAARQERSKPPMTMLEQQEKQWIFTESEILRSPSIADGMDAAKERELRSKGVNFILQVGVMLKLPQLTLSTGAIFFNRYLMRNSMVDKPGVKALHHYQVAATSLFLASKVEENCRKMKDLVIACCRVAQKNPNLIVDEQTKDYWRWRDTILLNEDVLLETLCFDLTIEAPHNLLFDMLKYYNVEHNKALRNAAWAFIIDSNLTQSCLLFTSRTIAAAALYCAAKHCDLAFPDDLGPSADEDRPWWDVLGVSLSNLQRACNHMAAAYVDKPLKGSGLSESGGESIYVGLQTSPEHLGDPELAFTRLRRSEQQVPPPPQSQSPLNAVSSATSGLSSQAMDRVVSDQGSIGGYKRSREGSVVSRRGDGDRGSAPPLPPPPALHHPTAPETSFDTGRDPAEPEAKKARVGGLANGQNGAKKTKIPPAAPLDDAGSEEGEVEE